jgi:hypothetical protein
MALNNYNDADVINTAGLPSFPCARTPEDDNSWSAGFRVVAEGSNSQVT